MCIRTLHMFLGRHEVQAHGHPGAGSLRHESLGSYLEATSNASAEAESACGSVQVVPPGTIPDAICVQRSFIYALPGIRMLLSRYMPASFLSRWWELKRNASSGPCNWRAHSKWGTHQLWPKSRTVQQAEKYPHGSAAGAHALPATLRTEASAHHTMRADHLSGR
jgi:hypothetical protein